MYRNNKNKAVNKLFNEAMQEYLTKDFEISLDNSNQSVNEKIRDAKGEITEKSATEEEIEHVFSEEHTRKMEEFIEDLKRKEGIKVHRNLVRNIAVLLVCVIGINTWLIPNCKAIKEKIERIYLKDRIIFSVIDNTVGEKNEGWKYKGKIVDVTPFTYFPLEFDIDLFEEKKYTKRINLANEDKFIHIKVKDEQFEKFDTEDVYENYIKISNIPVIYYEKNGIHIFVYIYNKHVIQISGNADYEDLVKIIKKME